MATRDDYQDFKVALNDLKMNSKPLINVLTILAEEKLSSASQIVRAIEEHIIETKGDYVLPALYVLDSIVKNLRSSVYVQLFETKLPVLFATAFHKVDERTRSAMFKLRQTWPSFFSNLSLYNLDTRTHDIDPAWPITARVPDPPPFASNIHLNPNFLQRNSTSVAAPQDTQTVSDDVHQQAQRLQQDSDSTVFRTRTVHQPPVSMAPPKISELTTRSDTYHMIPLERMKQIRQETAHVLDLGVDGEQQSKIKKLSGKKKKSGKKRRPSARFRRRAIVIAQTMINDDQQSSSSFDNTDSDGDEQNNNNGKNDVDHDEDDDDGDDDDEPFVIKKSSAAINGIGGKSTISAADSTSGAVGNEVEQLFGGTDKDYRETDVKTQSTSNSNSLDADSIFEINSKCLLVAEQKYKSKELSPEEYQATLRLLQNILESEVKRLTVQQRSTSVANNSAQQSISNQAIATHTHPFQRQLLQFTQQHASQTASSTFSNSSFPYSGFGNDAHRHVMQILAAVGAPSSYSSSYNFLSYLPPLPPAPPAFPLVPNTFQTQQNSTSSEQQLFSVRQSPPLKRTHDENNEINNQTICSNDDNKRVRYDPVTGRATRARNFDDENVAPVPSLIDANINILKKKYIGVIQQLYIGKYQCRLCGLRFTAKQKSYYTHHLDWHYIENKQEKDLSTPTLSQRNRNWYPSVQEWTVYEENIEEQIRAAKLMSAQIRATRDNNNSIQGEKISSSSDIISCPAAANGDDDDDRCYVCHDQFETFFDENREEWHLKDAIRVDGKTYHPICYQDVKYETRDEKTLSNELSSGDNLSGSSKMMNDGNLQSDATIDTSQTMGKDESQQETVIEAMPSQNDSNELITFPKSMSIDDLVGSFFIRKEDVKVNENFENTEINVSESITELEKIPFLSSNHDPAIQSSNNNSDENI